MLLYSMNYVLSQFSISLPVQTYSANKMRTGYYFSLFSRPLLLAGLATDHTYILYIHIPAEFSKRLESRRHSPIYAYLITIRDNIIINPCSQQLDWVVGDFLSKQTMCKLRVGTK